MNRYRVTLMFTEVILGTVSKDRDVYEQFVLSKAAALGDAEVQEELSTVEHIEKKGWTGFHRKNDEPFLYSYVIKGFFKDACGMLRRASGTKSSKLVAYKKVIDGLVFIKPRQIPLVLPDGQEMGTLERPLRGQAGQKEIVALARSDTCPIGTMLIFTVIIMGQVTEVLLREWLDYGMWRGLGQWRNAGYGTFSYKLEKVT